jgi:hypothetical protein
MIALTTALKAIFRDQLDLSKRKIDYLLNPNMGDHLAGCFFSIINYGYTPDNFAWDVFVEVIGEKLSDDPEVEYEFSTSEYNSLLALKQGYQFVNR